MTIAIATITVVAHLLLILWRRQIYQTGPLWEAFREVRDDLQERVRRLEREKADILIGKAKPIGWRDQLQRARQYHEDGETDNALAMLESASYGEAAERMESSIFYPSERVPVMGPDGRRMVDPRLGQDGMEHVLYADAPDCIAAAKRMGYGVPEYGCTS